jgi:hypothetical protein
MSGFEVGNVYSRQIKENKTYYMAINKETLITYMSGRFGKFTTKKRGHISENGLSVSELCEHWKIKLNEFDKHMWVFFHPDEDAKMRARKEKYEEL